MKRATRVIFILVLAYIGGHYSRTIYNDIDKGLGMLVAIIIALVLALLCLMFLYSPRKR